MTIHSSVSFSKTSRRLAPSPTHAVGFGGEKPATLLGIHVPPTDDVDVEMNAVPGGLAFRHALEVQSWPDTLGMDDGVGRAFLPLDRVGLSKGLAGCVSLGRRLLDVVEGLG
jgi:hypothetical protein